MFFLVATCFSWCASCTLEDESEAFPVSTRRRFDVVITSFGRQHRCYNVKITSCVYWVQVLGFSLLFYLDFWSVIQRRGVVLLCSLPRVGPGLFIKVIGSWRVKKRALVLVFWTSKGTHSLIFTCPLDRF